MPSAPAYRVALRTACVAVAMTTLLATLVPLAGAADDDGAYEATIRRTTNGIPHIRADDYESLGYGYGYAFAKDNICTAADFYVTVNGQRSRWFGPDGSWSFNGNGTVNNNLDSDFFYTAVNQSGIIESELERDPPHGPVDELTEMVAGYVDGYNRYLADVGGSDGVSDPRCAGEPWVRPIREIDAYRRFFQLASLASSGVAIPEIGSAQPPTPDVGGTAEPGLSSAERDALVAEFEGRFHDALGVGSNAYGLGSQATDNGSGMVLGNPHFPWHGGERLYQSHLTIPGMLDVSGASLLGVPIVLIGHTTGMAWSHTVSTAFRFTPFELRLVPGSPTTYLVDGEPVEMERQDLTVAVRGEDGEVTERTRTLYSTIYGPITTGILGLPLFPWTPTTAFALGDANRHLRYLNHFFEKNHAQSVDELLEVQTRNQGVPWVNTIAADSTGRAYYADISVVPHVTDAKAQTCNTALGQATSAALRLPVLDGSRSECDWGSDDDAVVDGIFGPDNLPLLIRDDYVTNSNDSYWLTNPEEPLTGFDRIIGDEGTARTLRTRLGLVMVDQRLSGTDDYADDPQWPQRGFSQDLLQDLVFNNRQHAGELVRDDLVGMCRSMPGGVAPSASGPVPVDGACDVLEAWNLRDDLDASGAILFRRFWAHASGAVSDPWVNGFDAADPVHTPNTLDTDHPQVRQALGDAINDLDGAGIPLDAGLRGWQYEVKDGEAIPIHGGPGGLGVFNAINVGWDPDAGYPDVEHGSSFVMVVAFTPEAECPVDADAIVTYSQSEDVTRPFFADQTRMYADKQWNGMLFCEDEIAADPNLTATHLASTGEVVADTSDEVSAAAAPGPPERAGTPATGGGLALLGLLTLAAAALLGAQARGPRRQAR